MRILLTSSWWIRQVLEHVIYWPGQQRPSHYTDVIMGGLGSQITSLTIVYSTVYSGANQRKYQSFASLAFVRGNHRGPVNCFMFTIVSWPNHKQRVIVHTSDLMMLIRQSMYILSIITKEMGKLKTHSPTYCIMDNWENMPNLTHTLDKLYLTGILLVQCLKIKFAQWR